MLPARFATRQPSQRALGFIAQNGATFGRDFYARQRAMLFWWKKEEWPAIREALQAGTDQHLALTTEG